MERQEALYLHFRRSCIAMQARFAALCDLRHVPRVFLHGNPHVDNFARTEQGEAMIDFDRSRTGPYAWDVVRFFCSLSLRRDTPDPKRFLAREVIDAFVDAYAAAFDNPDSDIAVPHVLAHVEPKPHERSMGAYLAADKRWAKKLRKNPVFPSHSTVVSLLRLYFEGRYEADVFDRYRVIEAGLASGSLGMPRMLIVIADKTNPAADQILLDIKEVYQDPDTSYFFNPYVHHGLRMIEASHLYAPGMEEMMSFLTWRGTQYWGRKVPCFKAKLEGQLSTELQRNFAVSIGVQLGRAHRRSLRATAPQRVVGHLKGEIDTLLGVGQALNREVIQSFEEGGAMDRGPSPQDDAA